MYFKYRVKRKWNRHVKPRRKYQVLFYKKLAHESVLISILLLVLVVLGLAGRKIYDKITVNPYFNLSKINLEGVTNLSSEEINKACGPILSVNIFKINTEIIADNLRKNPLVKKVSLRRRWPNQLSIYIVERQPVAFWLESGQIKLLDKEGVLLNVPSEKFPDLAVIEGASTTPKQIKTILACIEQINNKVFDFTKEVAKFEVNNFNKTVLYLKNGLEIRLGSVVEKKLPEKLTKLQMVMADTQARAVRPKYIDLRFKNIVIKP